MGNKYRLSNLTAKSGAVFGASVGTLLTGIFFVKNPEFLDLPLENIVLSSAAAIGVTTFGMAATGYMTEIVNKYFPKDQ